MTKILYDACAGETTLDLDQLRKVAGSAIANARNALNDSKRKIDNELEAAMHCEYENDEQGRFTHLCHANTESERIVRHAQQYADAVKAYFYLTESIRREKVITKSQPKGGGVKKNV